MGGKGSGRRAIKMIAIEAVLDVQLVLYRLAYEMLDGDASRDEIKAFVEEALRRCRVAQEEIERIRV